MIVFRHDAGRPAGNGPASTTTNFDRASLAQNLEIGRGSTSHPALVREVPAVWVDHFDLVAQAYRRGFQAGRAVAHV